MLVTVHYKGDDSRKGVQIIDDWHLPSTAVKTDKTDEAGRTIYLIETTVVEEVVFNPGPDEVPGSNTANTSASDSNYGPTSEIAKVEEFKLKNKKGKR